LHDDATVGISGKFGALQADPRMDALYANDRIFARWNCDDRIASPAWDLWRHNFASDPKAKLGATAGWATKLVLR
jgi:hypothetical protein